MSGSAKIKGFDVIGAQEVPDPVGADAESSALAKINTQMLLLALGALSKRALTAITNLFTLALVGSAWWLWYSVLPNPTLLQLVGVCSYAVFALAIDIVRRRG